MRVVRHRFSSRVNDLLILSVKIFPDGGKSEAKDSVPFFCVDS